MDDGSGLLGTREVAARTVNARLDLLRAHTFDAWDKRGTEEFPDAIRSVVDGWVLFPAVAAKYALEQARAERLVNLSEGGKVDVVAEGLGALRESNEALVLAELRRLCTMVKAPDSIPPESGVCGTCAAEDCQGGPDCNYRARLRLGISEQWARKLRRTNGSPSSAGGRRDVPRENAAMKGRRLLTEARLRVLEANEHDNRFLFEVRGDHAALYTVEYGDGMWSCSCPTKGLCSHQVAAMLVVVVQ